jgi:hypothetical protein
VYLDRAAGFVEVPAESRGGRRPSLADRTADLFLSYGTCRRIERALGETHS